MNSAIEEKLLKNGYAGDISDLIHYAGSEDGLIWYWDNFLEKVLRNARGFYSGAFIRYKVKSEARVKYTEHLTRLHEEKIRDAKDILEKITAQIKAQKSEISLNEWFIKYNLENDFDSRERDFELFIEESGFFDIYNTQEKDRKLEEFLNAELFPYPYAGLFRNFISEHRNSSREVAKI